MLCHATLVRFANIERAIIRHHFEQAGRQAMCVRTHMYMLRKVRFLLISSIFMMEMITRNHLNGAHNEDINSSVIHTHTRTHAHAHWRASVCNFYIEAVKIRYILEHYFMIIIEFTTFINKYQSVYFDDHGRMSMGTSMSMSMCVCCVYLYPFRWFV